MTVITDAEISSVSLASSVVFPAGGTGNPISVAVIADEKSQSSQGGGSSTSFTKRELNTEISDPDGIVSIASDQFTLSAGTYLINWSAPAYVAVRHQTQLYDATGSSVLKYGTSEYNASGSSVMTRSFGSYIHTITSNNTYEIQHRVGNAHSPDGLGVEAGMGNNNIYTLVVIYKLK